MKNILDLKCISRREAQFFLYQLETNLEQNSPLLSQQYSGEDKEAQAYQPHVYQGMQLWATHVW